MDVMEVIEIVTRKSAGNEKLDNAESIRFELRLAALHAHAVEVDTAGHEVDADVLDSPGLVVSGQHVDVGVAVAVRGLTLTESDVLSEGATGQDSIKELLFPEVLEAVVGFGNRNSSIEVGNDVLGGAAAGLIVEVGLLGDLVPTALISVLAEVGDSRNLSV